MDVNQIVTSLIAQFGDGSDGSAPTSAQWSRILQRDADSSLTLVNFFKFRDLAAYPTDDGASLTGSQAFERYAEVSIPSMQRAGGEFLAVAPFAGSFLGREEDWDLIAIGKYPNLESFLALHQNEDYVRAFRHRSAAVAKQSVVVMNA